MLDFGATSSHNINYLTSMGHSVYMANVVQDAARPEWRKPLEEGGAPEFDVAGFVAGKPEFFRARFRRGAGLGHGRLSCPRNLFPRYLRGCTRCSVPVAACWRFFMAARPVRKRLLRAINLPIASNYCCLRRGLFRFSRSYQTRQIEKFLKGYASVRFFLGKDNIREVIAIR